jgi:hypothetical protein
MGSLVASSAIIDPPVTYTFCLGRMVNTGIDEHQALIG